MNFARVLQHHAEQRPHAPALRDSRMHLTYLELTEASARLASVLTAHGVTDGARVAVVSQNSAALALLYAATIRLGAIFTPLNYRLTSQEVSDLLSIAQPTILVADEIHYDRLKALTFDIMLLTNLIDQSRYAEDLKPIVDAQPSDANMILFTSGTTGLPKGAVLTHMNVFVNCANVAYHQQMSACDVTYIVLPLYHTAAMHLQLTPIWYCGGEAVLCETWDAETVAAVLRSGQITTLFLLPEQWRDVTQLLVGQRLHLREPITGGARVPERTLDAIERIFGRPPSFIMGMTEVSPQIHYMPGRDMRVKNGSIGRPTLWADIRVVDDALNPVRPGEVGEMCVRGPLVMREYWNAPEETGKCFDSFGYFHGGDLVIHDEEGYFWIVDRKKDLIRSGGENVYSVEVERVLGQHPSVREVAVVGIPHERWGEGVAAVVVPEPGHLVTLGELQEFSKRHLASYKKPIYLEIVEELPRNATGKVLKHELRRWLTEKLK